MQTMSSVMQFDHKFPPNCWPFSNIDQTGQPWQDGGGNPASSLHVGGVNVLFADGSVRFIPDSIDLELWRRLGTFNAGDISKP
jgi:prepilin-type processing-associated H-X9-DG protein